MARLPMSEVVYRSEWGTPVIGARAGGPHDAKSHLASRMFTDAVFNQDIRTIQTIINRIDGGLPKDTDVDVYQTLFGDCLNEVLSMTSGDQLRVLPTDTVMMALCKSLYDLSIEDIHHEFKTNKDGSRFSRKINPSAEKRQTRDSARRLVLERAGGRKTATPKRREGLCDVGVADWIVKSLPQEGETYETGPEV